MELKPLYNLPIKNCQIFIIENLEIHDDHTITFLKFIHHFYLTSILLKFHSLKRNLNQNNITEFKS